MGYKKNFVTMKVNHQVSNVFAGIIDDMPSLESKSNNTDLIPLGKGELITYDRFYMIICKSVLEFIPNQKENILIKIVKNVPGTIKNVRRIQDNKGILEFQNEILDKYFYCHGEHHIKDKINELKEQIDELIDCDGLEYLDTVLGRFEERMRDGLLNDMEKLSVMLSKRK